MSSAATGDEGKVELGVFGSVGVGKTCITVQYVKHYFVKDHDPTIEDFFETKKQFKDTAKPSHVVIYDTAGQDNYQSLVPQYLRNAEGVMLIYAINDKESFNKLQDMTKKLMLAKEVDDLSLVPVIVVANKCDLVSERKVSADEGKQFAAKLSVPYIETSAKARTNIDEAFELLAFEVFAKRKKRALLSSPSKKKEGCEVQ